MYRLCGHPNNTHVGHQPVPGTKGWETRYTGTLANHKRVDVLSPVLGNICVEGGVSGNTLDGEAFWISPGPPR